MRFAMMLENKNAGHYNIRTKANILGGLCPHTTFMPLIWLGFHETLPEYFHKNKSRMLLIHHEKINYYCNIHQNNNNKKNNTGCECA